MQLTIPMSIKDQIGDKLLEKGFEEEASFFKEKHYGSQTGKISITVDADITLAFVEALSEIATELDLRSLQTLSKQTIRLLKDPNKEEVKNLRTFETALASYVRNEGIKGWLFESLNEDDHLPFVVSDIKFIEACRRTETPQHVKLSLNYNSAKDKKIKSKTVTFMLDSVRNKTVPNILAEKKLFKETEELIERHLNRCEYYMEIQPLIGKQFSGIGITIEDSYYKKKIKMDGPKPFKLVNDDEDGVISADSGYTEFRFWKNFESEHNIDPDQPSIREVPFHPYIRMFELEEHNHYWVLAHQLELYQYDTELGKKLVLPDIQRDLIDILVHDMDVVREDIVGGKSGGTTVLCMGKPGLGKTLTAEVYSEVVQRPLYRVHSGQLGTTPDKVDDNLKRILQRAERWRAITLIDEADLYIRERGDSMEHNAIVAAFLRQLEYFNGLLFMTTNRANDVDDAIKSRSAAIIKYESPSTADARRLWEVLSEQYEIELGHDMITSLIEEYPSCAGRDIKELLKLAARYKNIKGETITLETFRHCAVFRGIGGK